MMHFGNGDKPNKLDVVCRGLVSSVDVRSVASSQTGRQPAAVAKLTSSDQSIAAVKLAAHTVSLHTHSFVALSRVPTPPEKSWIFS